MEVEVTVEVNVLKREVMVRTEYTHDLSRTVKLFHFLNQISAHPFLKY